MTVIKKIFIGLFITSCFVLNAFAANTSMSNELRESASNISLTYEYMEEGTSIDVGYEDVPVIFDTSNKIKVTVNNLPKGMYVFLESKNLVARIMAPDSAVYLDGGVYQVKVLSYSDYNFVRKFEVFIPIYNQNTNGQVDAWFDGTYEQKTDIPEVISNSKINIHIILIVAALTFMLILIILILHKRRIIK